MISTKKFAELNGVEANTVYRRYSVTGSYWGVVPEKLINNRLRWPERRIHKVTVTKHTQEA